jgi:argininosuccinate lyase
MKLWQNKNIKLNELIEAFETKEDLLMDQKLLEFDIKGSLAHARMLLKIGILNAGEFTKIEIGLNQILELNEKGKFKLEFGDEDIHTKIENYLTKNFGEVGKKIHTYRSRNDQVSTALRLYSKSQLKNIEEETKNLIKVFKGFQKEYGDFPIPGYTHMQKAMPSTINLWVGAFIASLEDDLLLLETAHKLNDQSPLGSAAGYGLPVKIDRGYPAKLLGFSRVQEPVTYVQNSRGRIEAATISSMISVLQTINKLASDILLFTTSEFCFFKAADGITTGSSIMPQKKNVDLAELLRSKVHIVLGNYISVVSLSSNLISGYNRDLQDSKKPLMESFEITLDSLKVTQILIKNIKPNKEVLQKAMSDELYQTKKAYKLVEKGMSFREAYLKVKGGDNNEN